MSALEIIRAILGIIYLCFLPGFSLTYAIFEKKELDFITRFTLSIVFSIASVTLLTYLFNLAGVRINLVNLLWQTALIIATGPIVILIKNLKTKR